MGSARGRRYRAVTMTETTGRQADDRVVEGGKTDPAQFSLADLDEEQILQEVLSPQPSGTQMLVGPGDDTALLAVPSGRVLVTTDAMVLGRDWLDEWSSAADVGAKCVAQNLADIAAMGGVTTGVVVTLAAAVTTPVAWAREMSRAIAQACAEHGVAVLGGDLSSAPDGVRMVSITAMGEIQNDSDIGGAAAGPVLRSGARVGDVVAVSDALGRSGAGLLLLQRDSAADGTEVRYHLHPRPDYTQGPAARLAGATSMLDISDGLVRDAGRIAMASGVALNLDSEALAADVETLRAAVGDAAQDCVLNGGEEHTLLATFPASAALPVGWRWIGHVSDGSGVKLNGKLLTAGGWDHFAG